MASAAFIPESAPKTISFFLMCVVCLYLFGYNYKKRPFVFCYGYTTFTGPIDAWIPCKSGHGN